MSRSRKYHTFTTWCGGSNRKDKRLANRRFRRINNLAIKHNFDKILYKLRECSNVWTFNTDGLAHYISPKVYKQLRTWAEWSDEEIKQEIEKIMRK